MKWFKKTYPDRIACGKWNNGDAVNYNEPKDESYTVEFIEESEYNTIKANVKTYFENIEKAARIIELKEKIYIREQIQEDKTDYETELDYWRQNEW